jgi:replication factor C small subunit
MNKNDLNKNSNKLPDSIKVSESLVEKYRPKYLDSLVGQEHIDELLQDIIEKGKNGDLDNFIFIGPTGVGKTSAARILAREIIGTSWKSNFEEINVPNDNKDLEFINNNLMNFIRNKPVNGALFKIVFFDECEELTPGAQSALRKILEDKKYKYARYIFATNYSEKLMTQIQGERITILHFRKIPNHIMELKLKVICEKEGIELESDALNIIIENADGSLRKGVKNLGVLRNNKNIITLNKVKNYFSYIEPSEVKKLLQSAINQQDYDKELNEIIINKCIKIEKLLQEIVILVNDKANFIKNEKERRYIMEQISLYSLRIDQSSDKMLQMKCFLNSIARMRDTCNDN